MNQYKETFGNRQFAYFLATLFPIFVVAIQVVNALGLSPTWAFAAGVVVAMATEPISQWFIEWRDARQMTEKADDSAGEDGGSA